MCWTEQETSGSRVLKLMAVEESDLMMAWSGGRAEDLGLVRR